MVKVYRVEHKDTKIGPWATLDCPMPGGGFFDCSVRPLPERDGLTHRKGWESGVSSKRMVRHWFPKVVRDVWGKSYGMVLVEFEVPRDAVERGQYQVQFDRQRATVVATRDLAEWK